MIIPGLFWLKFENCFIIDVISEQQSIKICLWMAGGQSAAQRSSRWVRLERIYCIFQDVKDNDILSERVEKWRFAVPCG